VAITAKVQCNLKQTFSFDGFGQATIGFCADYTDDRNQEWAQATPFLDLRMTVRGAVADRFEPGRRYTLVFEPDETPETAERPAEQP
jgi:hypothetical protein